MTTSLSAGGTVAELASGQSSTSLSEGTMRRINVVRIRRVVGMVCISETTDM